MSENTIHQMLRTHPVPSTLDIDEVARCVEACLQCRGACTSCADACLNEPQVEMLRHCIRLNLDCAAVCDALARVLARNSEASHWRDSLLQACAQICRACAEMCEQHADELRHCRVCAEVCRECQRACEALLAV